MRRFRYLALTFVAAVVAALSIPASASSAEPLDYVAMGDSFASGAGAGDYFESNSWKGSGCYQSTNAYAPLWAGQLNAQFDFQACSGATIPDIHSNQLGTIDSNTDLITLSVGGNDVGFADVITDCTLWSDSTCIDRVNDAEAEAVSRLPGELGNLYSTISQAAPNAEVVIIGYPLLFSDETCWGSLGISRNEQAHINDATYTLKNVTETAATNAGFTFVDPIDEFAGHGVCTSTSYVNGLSSDLAESYHPNATGHSDGFIPALNASAPVKH
ncbi:SGNH/GDSL hydrolase family protein [Haloglycomyces albus]|uniref:SGNH/GDSL hydrolase family protein n=1 Tax=Haloglycomyces albus TaxID=526067 RepID=UPI00046CBAE1|nr:SGNH/GDSL hydrolase family protein [Haloglycomyces albus]